MNRFYIVGYSQDEIAQGKVLTSFKAYEEVINQPYILNTEMNNVLVYNCNRVTDEFKEEHGNYHSYDFIKDSIMPTMQKHMKLNIIDQIDEEDLPKNLVILFKL